MTVRMLNAEFMSFAMEDQQRREQAEAARMDRMRAERQAMEEAMRAERAALEQELALQREEARLRAEREEQLRQQQPAGEEEPCCD